MLEGKKVELFKAGNNEASRKLNYMFCVSNGNDWKRKYRVLCSIKGITPIEQGNMSDYDYFLLTHGVVEDTDNIAHYYLVVDGEPATYITLTLDSTDLVDVTYATSKKFLKQGCATKSVEMIEDLLFANSNIRGIKLLDQNSTGSATTKIAIKLGFDVQQDDEMTFIKNNPNYISQVDKDKKNNLC